MHLLLYQVLDFTHEKKQIPEETVSVLVERQGIEEHDIV